MNMKPLPVLLALATFPSTLVSQGPAPVVAPQDHQPPLARISPEPGGFRPLRGVHVHVCGFHFYSGDMGRQVTVQHYCSRFSPDVMQCVLFDADREGARLIGVEYIVSARLFKTFSPEEKSLWHSHDYEVKSGQLTAPDLGPAEEKTLMASLQGTYGKTWQTWQFDHDQEAPMGIPQLMMGFTADGQAHPERVAKRDREEGRDTAAGKTARADLPPVAVDPGANAWQKGRAVQLDLRKVPMRGRH